MGPVCPSGSGEVGYEGWPPVKVPEQMPSPPEGQSYIFLLLFSIVEVGKFQLAEEGWQIR